MPHRGKRAGLWIDEAGDFSKKNDVVVVGGLAAPALLSNRIIRRALKDRFPGFPWPLHAAHYRTPVFIALANVTERGIELRPVAGALDAAAESAVEFLTRLEPDAMTEVQARFESGKLPPFERVRALERGLRQGVKAGQFDSAQYRRLAAARDSILESLRHALAVLCDRGGFPVLSAEASRGAAGSARLDRLGVQGLSPTDSDRYLSLLVGACQAAARRAANDHLALAPKVLTRGMQPGRQLAAEDVDRAVSRTGQREQFLPAEVASYDRWTHACHIFADFIANAGRIGVARAGTRLDEIGERVSAELGIATAVEIVRE